MVEDVRRRSACDRCHSQKLRCPRRPGVAVCDRCLKARKSCIFSPFRQKKTPGGDSGEIRRLSEHRLTPTKDDTNSFKDGNGDVGNAGSKRRRPARDLHENAFDPHLMFEYSPSQVDAATTDEMNIDYSFSDSHNFGIDCIFDDFNLGNQSPFPTFNFSPMSPPRRDEVEPKLNGVIHLRSPTPPAPVESKTHLLMNHNLVVVPGSTIYEHVPLAIGWKFQEEQFTAKSVSECVQRLSELSTELYEHQITLPPVSIHDPDPVANEESEDDPQLPPSIAQYRLDDTFRLTQEMVDIYPSVINACARDQPLESSKPASRDSSHFGNTPQSDATNLPEKSKDSIDHSSILLALSCHLRLIEIYEQLFEHMDICVSRRGVGCPLNKKQAQLTAPTLKIGSYAPPQSSAVPMQMLLLIQLASQLSNHASDLATQVKSIKRREQCGDGADQSNRGALGLSLAAAENVMGRANNMAQQLSLLRSKMLNQGLLA